MSVRPANLRGRAGPPAKLQLGLYEAPCPARPQPPSRLTQLTPKAKKHPKHPRFCHIYYMPGRGPRPFTRFRWRDRSNSQLEEKAAQSDAHSDSESGDSAASQPSSEPPISRIKHGLHRRNAQSARFPANPVCGSRAQRLPGRIHVPTTGRAGQTRLGTRRLSVGGGRCPEI